MHIWTQLTTSLLLLFWKSNFHPKPKAKNLSKNSIKTNLGNGLKLISQVYFYFHSLGKQHDYVLAEENQQTEHVFEVESSIQP